MDYQKVYTQLISHRKSNPLEKSKELYTELHHIVPRCLGGTDDPENLVRLTAREHFIAHRLLSKIYVENSELALSVLLMMKVQGGIVSSSKGINKLRITSSDKSSEVMTGLWNSEKFREMMSTKMRERWKDPKIKERMTRGRSEKTEKQWEDKTYKTKMLSLLEDPTHLEKLSSATKKLWSNETHRTLVSEKLKENWKDETYCKAVMEGRRKFLESNPMPWQRQAAKKTKQIWTLAATFWELSKYNPRHEVIFSSNEISKYLCSGKHQKIFYRMEELFKGGWIPTQCSHFLKDFGHKM